MNAALTPFEWTSGIVVILTPPNLRDEPNRVSCDFLASPPSAFSLLPKNYRISLPLTIVAFFARQYSRCWCSAPL
jgi:hypothetical protein